MPRIELSSIDDPRIDVYRDLRGTQVERRAGCFIAEGMWLVRRLLQSPLTTLSILADRQRVAEIGVPIPEHVPVYVLPDGQTEKVIGFNFHRGVLGCGARPAAMSIDQLSGLQDDSWLIVVCDQVHDPENVGGILRNSAAFAARAVMLGPQCADVFSRRVLRVAMGAPFSLPVVQSQELVGDLLSLRRQYQARIGVTVLAEHAEPLERATRPARMLLVFGSEGYGLADHWQSLADDCWTIPMHGMADSLNVAACSAVFLHYFQRMAKKRN